MMKRLRIGLGIIVGVVILLVVQLTTYHPNFVETIYYRGLYPMIRYLNDYTLGFLPFPIVYIAFPLMVMFIVRCTRHGMRDISRPFFGILLGLANAVGWLLAFFYIIWGFNYKRPSINESLAIDTSSVADSVALVQEYDRVTQLFGSTRLEMDTSDLPLQESVLPDTLEPHLRRLMEATLLSHDFSTFGRPRIRILHPEGTLLRIGTAGVYMPFAIEGQIDAGLHPIQYPYVMAHEFGHSYGFTDEGVCNFLALLACMKSDLEIVRYSALRSYWIYLARDVRRLDEGVYKEYYQQLPLPVKRDYAAVIEQMDRFPDIMPYLRDLMYDTYLKTNGVKAGLSSYGQVVGLALAYQEKYGEIF